MSRLKLISKWYPSPAGIYLYWAGMISNFVYLSFRDGFGYSVTSWGYIIVFLMAWGDMWRLDDEAVLKTVPQAAAKASLRVRLQRFELLRIILALAICALVFWFKAVAGSAVHADQSKFALYSTGLCWTFYGPVLFAFIEASAAYWMRARLARNVVLRVADAAA